MVWDSIRWSRHEERIYILAKLSRDGRKLQWIPTLPPLPTKSNQSKAPVSPVRALLRPPALRRHATIPHFFDFIIIIDSCLTSDAVPIKVHADYCRDIDTNNLQGEREW